LNNLFPKIKSGDRIALSRGITLIESQRAEDAKSAQQLVEACLPFSGNSTRIAITGIPGVGKSTFIESLGIQLIELEKKVAVLAIDPTSEISHGSILADKTRMEQLSVHPQAFIRPSPTSGSLGGVAKKTREAMLLCEAAGFDTILIETVGIGQSETMVHSMVDFFLLLMLSGAGDELQGIKRGVMEMADLVAINKCDGGNEEKATLAKREYKRALHLFPAKNSLWAPEVVVCSALENKGIGELWKLVLQYMDLVKQNGFFTKNRNSQAQFWMHQNIEQNLISSFYKNEAVKSKMADLEKEVVLGKISSFEAARLLLQIHKNEAS
jgi:LAO/AO transport system kinase